MWDYAEIQPILHRNMSPQSSASDNKPIKKQVTSMKTTFSFYDYIVLNGIMINGL